MKRFKSKGKEKASRNLHKIITFTFFLIIIFTFCIFTFFYDKLTKQILAISEAEINKVTYRVITDEINHDLLNQETLNNILVITKNKQDEILYVDFNFDQAYKILDSVSKVLTDAIDKMANGEIKIAYYNNNLSNKTNNIILAIPFGSVFKNAYFYNLGPKIPVKINFVGSVLTNLQTKITNYGLNNALVEVFVYIEFHNQIITMGGVKDLNFVYDAVIASKMIEGKVPSFYNGSITKNSDIYQEKIE